MFEGARVGVLIPAYNEATQIAQVLRTLPGFVDNIVVVNDGSTDTTADVVRGEQQRDARIVLIDLPENLGVGGALAAAYKWARDEDLDVAVSIDGDGQMDAEEMQALIEPIVNGDADYTKGNRLLDAEQWGDIPRVRFFGNAVLSLLTKPTSGYWAVADSQSGYTAAGVWALQHIDWDAVYPRYGRPNDVLTLANLADCRVADVPIRAIYGVGERSSMKIAKVTFAIAFLLVRRFWYRLFNKYVLRDFHPLVFFYLLAVLTAVGAAALVVRLVVVTAATGNVPDMTALAAAFLIITSLNSTFFAMWMDMQANADLNATPVITRRRRERMMDRHRTASTRR